MVEDFTLLLYYLFIITIIFPEGSQIEQSYLLLLGWTKCKF